MNDEKQLNLFPDKELELCSIQVGLKTFQHPKNDNELLFNLQFDYLVFNDLQAWQKMWLITYKVAERLIVKYYKKHSIYFNKEQITERKLITCEYLLRRYKKGQNYYVKSNFISAIKDASKHALLYTTKLDKKTIRFETCVASHKYYCEGELVQ